MILSRHLGSPRRSGTGAGSVLVLFENRTEMILISSSILFGPGPEHHLFMTGSVLDHFLTMSKLFPQFPECSLFSRPTQTCGAEFY